MHTGLIDDDIRIRREIKEILARLGLWELNSFPLGTEKDMGRANPFLTEAHPAIIANPISDDASTLRMSLVQGVIDTFVRNLRRGSSMYDVFEIGNVYWHDGTDFREEKQLIIGVLGDRTGKKKERSPERGFIKLKGYVEALVEAMGILDYDLVAQAGESGRPTMHSLEREGEMLAAFETLPADLLGGETFDRPIFTASFRWPVIRKAYEEMQSGKAFRALPSFPAVDRDLAFVLDESVAYRRMAEAIHEAGGEYLVKVGVFDIYRGKQLGENKKNIAVNLRFRHPSRTLNDEEVDGWMKAIGKLVEERTGGKLRDW
jgi:phenylalanyl-tRNA synthetase beta chain